MVEVGDVAIKIAGRDAGNLCVIVDTLEGNFVLIDGETRRRKCNLSHLEFLNKKLKLKKGASTSDTKKALKEAGFAVRDLRKGEKKSKKDKPKKIRNTKQKPQESAKIYTKPKRK